VMIGAFRGESTRQGKRRLSSRRQASKLQVVRPPGEYSFSAGRELPLAGLVERGREWSMICRGGGPTGITRAALATGEEKVAMSPIGARHQRWYARSGASMQPEEHRR